MSTVFFVLLHVFILFVMIICWKADSGNRVVFTPFVLFVAVEIVFTWSTWLLLLDTDVRVGSYEIMTSLTATLCFCIGFLLTSKYIRDRCGYPASHFQLQNFLERPILRTAPANAYIGAFLVLIIIGVACGTYYYQGQPPTIQAVAKIAAERELSEEIQSEVHDIVVFGRRELTKGHFFGGEYRGQGVFRSFMVAAWTYGMVLASVLAMIDRKRRWWLMVALFFIGAFYYVAGTGERSRFAWSVIITLIGVSFVSKISMRKMVVVGAILFCFLIMMTVFLKRYKPVEIEGELASNVVAGIANRIVSGNKISNVRIMNFLDDGLLHYTYGGNHLREFLNVLPGIHHPPLGHEVSEIVHPGRTTYLNGTYLSLVYIDFGFAGIVLIYFLLGALVRVGFFFLLKLHRYPANIAFLSLSVYNLGKMGMESGITSFLVGMLPVILTHCCILLVLHCLGYAPIVRWEGAR